MKHIDIHDNDNSWHDTPCDNSSQITADSSADNSILLPPPHQLIWSRQLTSICPPPDMHLHTHPVTTTIIASPYDSSLLSSTYLLSPTDPLSPVHLPCTPPIPCIPPLLSSLLPPTDLHSTAASLRLLFYFLSLELIWSNLLISWSRWPSVARDYGRILSSISP